jgi:uncharacterized cupredoxin-like copper-binding protein
VIATNAKPERRHIRLFLITAFARRRCSRTTSPGKRSVLRVVFHRAGAYPYVCTVPGHAQAGMKGVLRVTR